MANEVIEQKYGKGKHPNSLKNLIPMRKGEPTRNPGGRPTKASQKCISDALEVILREGYVDSKGRIRLRAAYSGVANVLAIRLLNRALKHSRDLELVLDRLEGKVVQPVAGQISSDIAFVIGKGYSEGDDDKPDVQPDKQDTE